MRTANGVVGAVSLHSQPTMLLAGRCESSPLTVLVHRVYNPVDARVIADAYVRRIDKYHFEVLIGRILVDPVRIEHSHVHCKATCSLLGNTAQITSVLELVDTLVLWLTEHYTLGIRSLTTTASHGHTKNNIALIIDHIKENKRETILV